MDIKDLMQSAPPPAPKAASDPSTLPPHIDANFKGYYYKAAAKGLEKIAFDVTVKVPLTLVRHPKRSAIGVFRDIIGPKVLAKFDGYSGVNRCYLDHTSALPDDLELYKQLDWTGDTASLAKFAKKHAPIVIPGMYNNSSELRHAIRVCMQDPKGFEGQQAKLLPIRGEELSIHEELAALGY